MFSAIYAIPESSLRQELWEELERLKNLFTGPWMLAGDFNETSSMMERNGSYNSVMQRRCREFANWIENSGLIDLGCSGPGHTWFRGNSPETFKSARLDRGLVNEDWRTRFPEGAVRNIPKVKSDHCPILISVNGFAPLPRSLAPFRFQAAWMNHEKFEEFVMTNWKNNEPLVPFLKKFAGLLSKWNRETFHNIFRRKAELFARLEGVQKLLSKGRYPHLIKMEARLRREMDDVLNQEELLWFQKSRMDAIRDGDRNTRYFHLSTIIRRRRNRIEALRKDTGEWTFDPDELKNMVLSYWKSLFQEDQTEARGHTLLCDRFPEITLADRASLSRPFAECEIRRALFGMKPFKAPGPNGFQPLFYQKYWEVVSPSLIQLVRNVLEGVEFPEGLNDAFLVLIPKMDNPQAPNHFRPIGLCNSVYKIVTKVVVNRFKPLLPSLISPTQCSFVPRRQITDNIIIVQEMMHTMRRKQGKKGLMAVKIDFEKAYDRLRWSFIRDSLLQLRLPQQMVDLVMNCIRSAKLQILWNGEPLEAFTPSRGIRQGDPLSPYLYVICMERLTHLIEFEISMGNWRPVRASRGGPLLSNLAFADDLILFAEASVDQAQVIRECLDKFCAASGSKVSFDKSRVYFSENTNLELRDSICTELQMEATSDLGKYLGVPTIHGRSTKGDYQYLVDRVNSKLAGWKAKTLSLAGRATLVQSCISTIPYYTMQSAKLPRATCDELDRKARKFLWGGNETVKKTHLVAWENVSKQKGEGGLGIRSMRQANAAFLAKLGWRILTEPDALWARVLRSKYCAGRCDVHMFKASPGASNAWRGITDHIDVLKKGISWAVGNGTKVMFWKHNWATKKPLIDLATSEVPGEFQDVHVKDLWDKNTGWKYELFAQYLAAETLELIEAHDVLDDEEAIDEVYWNGSPSGGFTVSSTIQIVRNSSNLDMVNNSRWKKIWRAPVPQRVRMFLWLASQDRLMHNVNRFVRKFTSDPRCYVCGEGEENTNHILRGCPAARIVWYSLGWDVNHLMQEPDVDRWIERNLEEKTNWKVTEWPSIFAVTLWWLWKWRNERCFSREAKVPLDQVAFIFAKVGEFLRATKLDIQHNGIIQPRVERFIRWNYPPEGWVRLNTDGAAKGNPGKAGAGGIIRGSRGELFEAFAVNCGVCSCTCAELLGVLRGLAIAWNGGHRKVLLSVDSEVVVKWLCSDLSTPSPFIHLVRRCKALVDRGEWEVRVSHCYREANRAADWLANYGVSSAQKLVIFEAVPRDLRAVLLEDLGGLALARMVPAAANGM